MTGAPPEKRTDPEPGAAVGSPIRLAIPADARFVRVARLATGGLASLLGFDVDTIDDLRIAVDEMCASLLESSDGTEISLELTATGPDRIRITGWTNAGTAEVDADRNEFSQRILSVVADEFGFDLGEGRARCWIERSMDDGWVATGDDR